MRAHKYLIAHPLFTNTVAVVDTSQEKRGAVDSAPKQYSVDWLLYTCGTTDTTFAVPVLSTYSQESNL